MWMWVFFSLYFKHFKIRSEIKCSTKEKQIYKQLKSKYFGLDFLKHLTYIFQVKTDRLMTLLPVSPDCPALEELPSSECPQSVLKDLLSQLNHPYIYPILDLDFHQSPSQHYACLVMPFNPKGSLKDLIHKVSNFRDLNCWSILDKNMKKILNV